MNEKEKRQKRISEIETMMQAPDFWTDKVKARETIKELQSSKTETEGGGMYDKGDAIMTIFSGAGGDDSEDFSAMLLTMYRKFFTRRGWSVSMIHQNQNDHGGFRNVTVEVTDPASHKATQGQGP